MSWNAEGTNIPSEFIRVQSRKICDRCSRKARERCWKYDFVIDLYIKGLFDNIDHELLMKAVQKHVTERWVILYIERWLKAAFALPDGELRPRTSGTSQGDVISPLLANLFMHYAFDEWMRRNYPYCPFERYR